MVRTGRSYLVYEGETQIAAIGQGRSINTRLNTCQRDIGNAVYLYKARRTNHLQILDCTIRLCKLDHAIN